MILNGQLEAAKQQAGTELNDRRKQYGPVPTSVQQREVRAFAQGRKNQLLKLKREADIGVVKRCNQLITTLQHGHVKPHAETVARERGTGVVLLRTTNTLVFLPENDIRDAVLEAVRDHAATIIMPTWSGAVATQSTN